MRLPTSLLALILLCISVSDATPIMAIRHRGGDGVIRHRSAFNATNDHPVLARAPPPGNLQRSIQGRAARRCAARSSSSTPPASTSTSFTVPGNVGYDPGTSTSSTPSPSNTPTKVIPQYWPTKTQSGYTYEATRASPTDAFLTSISEALNNDNNPAFQKTYTGDLTYYETGIVACGDTYTDDTLTAAVSHLLYNSWPGAISNPTLNPICGPFTPGRKALNSAGLFYDAITSSVGSVWIGGDGIPSCDPSVKVQCHLPMTVTITNPANGKSVSGVKIVDECAGCKGIGDIDVTRTTFGMLGDADQGRISGIQW
ncbi:uncharacterized protein EI90DRAFT_3288318, partial [Cantharellus anzutake]|uniref:uncharacterized protein n=1 Tax=Cantharellus anzutake TaxID=1750568 RepID=UPI001905D163